MATIRLVPSTYYSSSTTYLSVTNESNMYNNTDNSTYTTVTNTQNGTTSYYIYLRGFNFDDIPSGAVINSFSIKLKARESGITTSTSYAPKLCNGTSQITSTCSAVSTTASVLTFSGYTVDLDDIKEYGSNFGIRINCRRASRNTTGYMYIYGAEIDIDYTLPDPVVITSSLTGNGTIDPNGAYNTFKDLEYSLTITPTDKSDPVTVKHDGVDVTSQIIAHGNTQLDNADLGSYSLVSGGFNGSGASYFQGIVGNGVNASTTSSNYYSSSSSTTAVFTYDMSFNLPSNANITRVWCEVNGHAESTTQSSEYMCVQLISGSVNLTDEINYKNIGTSNTTVTLECETLPTVSQLASMKLQCRLGYYGGAINGATCYVEYDLGSTVDHYTYEFITTADANIEVIIGTLVKDILFWKNNGTWKEVITGYKKVNGVWVEQDITSLFSSAQNYRKGT